MRKNLRLRHSVIKLIRRYLEDRHQFVEIESTPEGARDFLVPSRFQVTDILSQSSAPLFAEAIKAVAVVKALCVPGGASAISSTRLKKGDVFQETKKAGLKGLLFFEDHARRSTGRVVHHHSKYYP